MASSKANGGGGGISPGLYLVITLIYLGSYLIISLKLPLGT